MSLYSSETTSLPSQTVDVLSQSSSSAANPSYATSVAQSSVLNNTTSLSNFDTDISDLLMDNFGPTDQMNLGYLSQEEEEKFIVDFDQNLPLLAEIFDDLQSAVTSKSNDAFIKEPTVKVKDKSEPIDPRRTIRDIHNEIEYKIELDRVERLRKPKFQTLPAFEKRAKQETQWRAAIRAAKRATSFTSTGPYRLQGKNLIAAPKPVPSRDPEENPSDLSSLDLEMSPCSTSSLDIKSSAPIVKSTLMVNTKKHLSAPNHFPANSRIFNRSLQQLQSQADAISSAYLCSNAVRKTTLPRPRQSSHPSKAPTPAQLPGNILSKTTNITRFLRDVNNNPVSRSQPTPVSSICSLVPAIKSIPPPIRVTNIIRVVPRTVPTNPAPSVPLHPVRRPQVLHTGQQFILPSSLAKYQLVEVPRPGATVITKIPPIVSKPKLQPAITPKARPIKKAPPKLPIVISCYNCQKLARVLPYLAHSRRKLAMSNGRVLDAVMVLLCDVCGSPVRETVIFGDYIVLDHVASAHFPLFLANTPNLAIRHEESQNIITQGEEWD